MKKYYPFLAAVGLALLYWLCRRSGEEQERRMSAVSGKSCRSGGLFIVRYRKQGEVTL